MSVFNTYKSEKSAQIIFVFVLIFSGFSLHAQYDSTANAIAPGIIVVKRPPVPASFVIKCNYSYPKIWAKKRPWESRAKTARRGYKAWLADPYPARPIEVNVASDSAQLKTGNTTFNATSSSQPQILDWNKYVTTIQHNFQWLDTMRLDSARFQYNVDEQGNSVCVLLPWNNSDSSSHKLEQEALPLMQALKLWYPAQHISNRNSKLENLSCTVIVTIYAYENNGVTPPPIVIESDKRK